MNYTDDWQFDDFERWEDAPPYSKLRINESVSHPLFDPELIWDFLNQKKVWVNKFLLEIPIKEMDKSYLFNVLKWADKNFAEINFTFDFAAKLGKFNPDTEEWKLFTEYPLFKKIEQRYLKLNGIKPEKEKILYG